MTKTGRLLVATLVLCASCDNAAPTDVDTASFEQLNSSSNDGKMVLREDLARVARAVALALGDPDVRSRMYADLRASKDREKKLALREYLDGPGLVLRQRMTSFASLTDDQLSSALRRLPPVDLYMPVREHRENWSGDDQLIVAYQLQDYDIPDGFDLEGGSVMLSRATPPSIPALVVVPQERPVASFSHAVVAEECTPEMIICDDPGGGGGSPPDPDGLYIDRMRIRHDGESWPRGDPELEVHVAGTQHGIYWAFNQQPPPGDCPTYPNPIQPGSGTFPCTAVPIGIEWLMHDENASTSAWVACSGEEASGARDFNYDDEQTYEGDVLIAEASTFFIDETIRGASGVVLHRHKDGLEAPVTILVTERDDGDQCPGLVAKNELYDEFSVEWSGGRLFPSSPSFYERLVHRLLGSGNDQLATFGVTSFTTLENASMHYMAGADVDIWLTNQGFDHLDIPPDVDPYTP